MQEYLLYQQIKQAINQSQRPMIVAHRRPDGDALGAAVSLFLIFEHMRSTHIAEQRSAPFLYCVDQAEKALRFFYESDKFSQDINKALDFNPDFIFFVDCGDLKQGGIPDVRDKFAKAKIANIDHHASNTKYGDANLVIASASSTCEVLYRFYKTAGIAIDTRVAAALFLGIFTDTNNFSNAATTPEALFAAADLWKRGIAASEIKNNLLQNKTISFLKLWGRAMERIKYSEELKLASTYVTFKDLEELGISGDSVEGFSNFLNANLNVETVVVLKELDGGVIRGSLRTTNDDFDMSRLAKVFGGGGHKKASGFSINGKIKKNGDSWSLLVSASEVEIPLRRREQ